jgi:hypothetical protein
MTGAPKTPASRLKKVLTVGVVFVAIGVIAWVASYLFPENIKLGVLITGYGFIYVGIIVSLYGVWQKYLSPAAEKADKAAAAAVDSAAAAQAQTSLSDSGSVDGTPSADTATGA